MSAKNKHINNLIDDYLSGTLNEEQTDELWARMIGDDDAMEYLQTVSSIKKMANDNVFDNPQLFEDADIDFRNLVMDSDDSSVPDTVNESQDSKQTVRPGWNWVAAAVLMIMAAAGIGYMVLQQDQNSQVEPIAAIEYDIFRSASDYTTAQSEMEDIIFLSASGNHAEAISLLNELRAEVRDESLVRINVLEATLYYNSGNYSQAATLFSEIELDQLTPREIEEVLWFTANAKLQTGQNPEARAILDEIIQMDGSFSRVAKNLLNKMNN